MSLSEKHNTYIAEPQDVPTISYNRPTTTHQQRPNLVVPANSAVVQGPYESWQNTNVTRTFDFKLQQDGSVEQQKHLLTYDVISTLKRDIKVLFANYVVSMENTEDRIKLICIRNSVLAALTTDFWELTQIAHSNTKQ